jgi:chromosome segregation ATPase
LREITTPSRTSKGKIFYAHHPSFRDSTQMIAMDQQIKELESQLTETNKGQIGRSNDLIKLTTENKQFFDDNREYQKKNSAQHERINELEAILHDKVTECERKEKEVKFFKGEIVGLQATIENVTK